MRSSYGEKALCKPLRNVNCVQMECEVQFTNNQITEESFRYIAQ
jgi:hypothetical protein